MLQAIGNHRIPMVGYALNYDRAGSSTTSVQKYNCHKLFEYRVGLPLEVPRYSLNSEETLATISAFIDDPVEGSPSDQFTRHVEAFSKVLEAERESAMDLEYWIDYLHSFGASHKIPSYDNMSFFYYYNLDVALLVIPLLAFTLLFTYMILYCVCSCVCKRCRKGADPDVHEHKD